MGSGEVDGPGDVLNVGWGVGVEDGNKYSSVGLGDSLVSCCCCIIVGVGETLTVVDALFVFLEKRRNKEIRRRSTKTPTTTYMPSLPFLLLEFTMTGSVAMLG